MILGLDVSTSITGATILDESGKTLYCEYWDLRNKRLFPDLFAKGEAVRLNLLEIALRPQYEVKEIYIEKSLQSFRPGFSSAKTLSTLAAFNGMVSWIAHRMLGLKPEYIAANSARKLCGIKTGKSKETKLKVLQFVVDNDDGFKVEYTKFGNPKPGMTDMADSWVLAKAGLITCKQKKPES